MRVHAEIGSRIFFAVDQVPKDVSQRIASQLTIANPAKPRALREMVRGAESMPDTIDLWLFDGRRLVLPRGYVHDFEATLNAAGYEVDWISTMTHYSLAEHCFSHLKPIQLRPYQAPAVEAMLDYASGIYQGPTGSGKTVTVLEALRIAGQPSIVIVEKTSVAQQWRERASQHLGFEPGIIGDDEWEVRALTIALRQSLWARQGQLDARFWGYFGAVVLDECHHAVADTLVDLLQRFSAFYRWGVSATAERDPETFPIARSVLGPIIHETTHEEVGEKLVRPKIQVVKTEFDFPYEPTRRERNQDTGRIVVVRNNYTDMMAALVKDQERNEQIAAVAAGDASASHHCLVVSRRKDHLKILQEMLAPQGDDPYEVFLLTGEQSGDDSTLIAERIEQLTQERRGSVLLSTVADEALDIPPLDRCLLAHPARKVPVIIQILGRIMRAHPMKRDAIFYDFVDWNVGLIKSQFRERRQLLYSKQGYEVVIPDG